MILPEDTDEIGRIAAILWIVDGSCYHRVQKAAFVTMSEGFSANGFIVKAHGEPAFNGMHGGLEEDQT